MRTRARQCCFSKPLTYFQDEPIFVSRYAVGFYIGYGSGFKTVDKVGYGRRVRFLDE